MEHGSIAMRECEFLVIGAGIAGAYAGYGLAKHGPTIVLEREEQPGYHTTGRSAAFYAETYGNRCVRALTSASKRFFLDPPPGFAEVPLVHPRGALYVAGQGQLASLDRMAEEMSASLESVHVVGQEVALRLVPTLRRDAVARALVDPECLDIDVAALHQGYLRGLARAGGELLLRAELQGLVREDGRWRADTTAGPIAAKLVVNAAGAWGDEVARLAGAAPLGLRPLRRTIVVFEPTRPLRANGPLVLDVDDRFYFKPEAGRVLVSPADETPSPPCDARPDPADVALAIERVEAATELGVARVVSRWAGLRTFARDKSPIVGRDPAVPGFFWLVGQGGYGMQTAPAMGELLVGLIVHGRVPEALREFGVSPVDVSPARSMA